MFYCCYYSGFYKKSLYIYIFLFQLISNPFVTFFIVFDLHQESDKLREGGKGG